MQNQTKREITFDTHLKTALFKLYLMIVSFITNVHKFLIDFFRLRKIKFKSSHLMCKICSDNL